MSDLEAEDAATSGVQRQRSTFLLTLPINCAECGGALAMETIEAPYSEQTWSCPHCSHESTWRVKFRILWVTRRRIRSAAR